MDKPNTLSKPRLTDDQQLFAIKTWRYIRLAMVALVVALAVAIAREWLKVHADCLQTSISGYYYTPVHALFIAALAAIGVCLFCLRGNTDGEDVLLNLAGACAPVVALVPTTEQGTCGVVHATNAHIHDNVVNNITAVLVVGGVALVILAGLRSSALRSPAARRGYALAAATWLGALLVFVLADHTFVTKAHGVAAGLMFVCIFIVVCINALDYRDRGPATSVRNRYGAIAVAMGVSFVAFPVAGLLGWDYWILGIEFALISLFATFWLIQTKDLWKPGLRPSAPPP